MVFNINGIDENKRHHTIMFRTNIGAGLAVNQDWMLIARETAGGFLYSYRLPESMVLKYIIYRNDDESTNTWFNGTMRIRIYDHTSLLKADSGLITRITTPNIVYLPNNTPIVANNNTSLTDSGFVVDVQTFGVVRFNQFDGVQCRISTSAAYNGVGGDDQCMLVFEY